MERREEEEGKTLVCDKHDRAITRVFYCDLHSTLSNVFWFFTSLQWDLIKGK